MERSRSTNLAASDRERLLALALEAIEHGLGQARPAQEPAVGELPEPLRAPGASFVTLTHAGELRGCCGVLEPFRPLAHDVWQNAWASAFSDPRFPALVPRELPLLEVEVSVLSRLEPLRATTVTELTAALEPHLHGLVLALGPRRATFLPKVWKSLPDPARFIDELRAKAGMPSGPWPPGVLAWRYTVESIRPGG